MIIVDLNQVVFSSVTIQHKPGNDVDEDFIRHIVLNCLRSYRTKFGEQYGELVIATDNRNYWRKKWFPYYKSHRKKARDDSGMNWPMIFQAMDNIKSELSEVFPYKYIDVEGAEADDVIGVLVKYVSENQPGESILIISGDKDFIQCQKHSPNIKQWDPIRKRWLTHKNPREYLFEHIIRGDAGDGIPNIRSDGNCLAIGKRQKPISEKYVTKSLTFGVPDEDLEYFARNKKLIDLDLTPDEIRMEILSRFEEEPKGQRSKLLNYFIKHRLKYLMDSISDF